ISILQCANNHCVQINSNFIFHETDTDVWKMLENFRVRNFVIELKPIDEDQYVDLWLTLRRIRFDSLQITSHSVHNFYFLEFLGMLFAEKDLSHANLYLKWDRHSSAKNIRVVKEWLLKMPETRELIIEWNDNSSRDVPDPELDDKLLTYLARHTSSLNMFKALAFHSTEGIENVYEAFDSTPLHKARITVLNETKQELYPGNSSMT
ncbi:hypothetical protein PFISCL1PPCAC_12524, partial [Pristionchus fissidentatus]